MVKIIDYKGNVTARWRTPKTKRQYGWTLIRLVRFYYRCKESKLLTNEIISIMQDFLLAIKDKVAITLLGHPELIEGIKEIQSLKPHDFEEQVVTEKMRKHMSETCSFCGTKLKYPAFIVYRKGLNIVSTSKAVGIFCLNGIVGKLKDLTVKINLDTPEQITPAKHFTSHPASVTTMSGNPLTQCQLF